MHYTYIAYFLQRLTWSGISLIDQFAISAFTSVLFCWLGFFSNQQVYLMAICTQRQLQGSFFQKLEFENRSRVPRQGRWNQRWSGYYYRTRIMWDCSWKTVKSTANSTSIIVIVQWKYSEFCFLRRWFCLISTSSGFCWQESEWIVGASQTVPI